MKTTTRYRLTIIAVGLLFIAIGGVSLAVSEYEDAPTSAFQPKTCEPIGAQFPNAASAVCSQTPAEAP